MSNITNLPQQPLPIGTEQSTNSYPELNNYNTSQPDVTQLPNYFQNGQYLQPNPLWNNSMWSNPLPNNIMQPQLQIYNPYSQFQIDTIKSDISDIKKKLEDESIGREKYDNLVKILTDIKEDDNAFVNRVKKIEGKIKNLQRITHRLNHRIYKLENNDNHNDNADDGIEEETEDILSQIMGFTKSSQNNNNIQEPKKNVIMMQSNPLTSLFDSLLPKKKVENENC